jgi:cellulose synthase (UDP-forming)
MVHSSNTLKFPEFNLDGFHTKTLPKSRKTIKKSIYSFPEKFFLSLILSAWLALFVGFVYWWITSTVIFTLWAFVLVTFSVMWLPTISLYFLFFASRAKVIRAEYATIPSGNVAMITTKIPSEDFELIKRSLRAMLDQNYPYKYDVWLADEDPSLETMGWCMSNGVRVSSRKGKQDYHREVHPRKAKTKEGNLAYFYDNWGYENYDFVVQFDADHAPEPDFLRNVMVEFNDPNVGYVTSPSITDGNLESSWTVRARCYWESTNHGPMQSGANNGFAPQMFGSHYSHRVRALKDIDGIAPEIAEDLTTTLTYNAKGWKGSHAVNAIAHGYGAVGVEDSMIQEYQWALVGMRAWFFVTKDLFKKLPWKVKIQTIVWHIWYPAVCFITLVSCLLPVYAILTGDPIVGVESNTFTFFAVWLNGLFAVYLLWMRSKNMLRPIVSWHLTWETLVFQILQWPWILLGSIEGFIQGIMGVPFYKAKGKVKITDKTDNARFLSWFFILPHFIIILLNGLTILSVQITDTVYGYFWFAFMVLSSYSMSISIAFILTLLENLNKLNRVASLRYIGTHVPTIFMVAISLYLTLQSGVTLMNTL